MDSGTDILQHQSFAEARKLDRFELEAPLQPAARRQIDMSATPRERLDQRQDLVMRQRFHGSTIGQRMVNAKFTMLGRALRGRPAQGSAAPRAALSAGATHS